MPHEIVRIGLISDTHGLLRGEAMRALRGSDHIVHAGDICDPDILVALARIAPVTAVRGNNDRGAWAEELPETATLAIQQVRLLVIHDLHALTVDPVSLGARVVISGHSHRPLIEQRAGVFYVNPGSAGPRRFRLPIAVGHLAIRGARVRARIRELNPPEQSVQQPTRADRRPSPPSRPKAGASVQAPRR